MPPSQRSRMERSPTSRCCSSCMDRALWKGWGNYGDGSRGQILGWGEGEWTEAASADEDAGVPCFCSDRMYPKDGAAWSQGSQGQQEDS